MDKYRVTFTNNMTGETLARIILNETQKEIITFLEWRDCFDRDVSVQIMSDNDEWKEFC